MILPEAPVSPGLPKDVGYSFGWYVFCRQPLQAYRRKSCGKTRLSIGKKHRTKRKKTAYGPKDIVIDGNSRPGALPTFPRWDGYAGVNESEEKRIDLTKTLYLSFRHLDRVVNFSRFFILTIWIFVRY
jgi:hypothetical protein